ncbi:hypothetical protein [Streptomyces syringium]|uniref:hypothetical protein n=1 Tax=Streptomyces syringium TaxID=76729 RepID=UPI003AAD16EF
MSFSHELLVLACLPIVVVVSLLIGHLTTLRGLRGDQRVAVFRLLADALDKRRR